MEGKLREKSRAFIQEVVNLHVLSESYDKLGQWIDPARTRGQMHVTE